MTSSGKRRLTKRQFRILVGVWVVVVILVGICTFAGIFIALNASHNAREAGDGPTQAAQVDAPTPTVPVEPALEQPDEPDDAEPTIAPRDDPSFGYGIQAQLLWNTGQTLDQVEQLGMNWVKHQVRWADIEREPGNYDWPSIDYVFEETSRRDLRLLVSVVDAPDWSRPAVAEGKAGPPSDYQLFANFVGQLLQRYPGAIHAVEVWNEMNLDREWYTGHALSASEYVQMLTLTSAAIRQVDPGVIVVSGALAPTGLNDYVIAVDDFQYMQDMINAGMLDQVDCVGAHANGINLPPDQSAEDAFAAGPPAGTVFIGPFDGGNPLNPHHSWSFYSTLTGYHDIIVSAGSNKPLCVTEFGWATVEGMEGSPNPAFNFAYDNSLQEQADNIVNAFKLMHDWDYVWLAFVFNLDFSPKAGGNPQDDSTLFSIVTPIGAPRPAYDQLGSMPKPP